MYMDWMANTDNLRRIQLGDEGKHHTYSDGIYNYNADYAGEDKLSANNNYEYSFIVEGIYYGDTETAMKNETASYHNDEAVLQYQMSMTDLRLDPWFFPYFKKPIQSEAQFATSMQDKYKEMFTVLIMCSPDEFDGKYDSMVNEFMTLYGNEVCAERAKVWEETVGK